MRENACEQEEPFVASKRARPDDEKTLNGGSQYRRGCCSAVVCCTVCLTCCCILLAAAFSAWWRLHSLSLEPLDIELVEGHMGCDEGALVDESFAPFGASRYISSRGNDRHAAALFRERVKDGIYEMIRVQIVNGTLFLSCRRRAGAAAAAVADASWCTAAGMMAGGGMDAMMVHAVRTLDLLLSIARVPDVDFFIDVREHACHFHPRQGDALPVLTAETNVHKGCHNLLMPPRAFLSLPDGANLEKLDRWGVLDHVEQNVRASWTEEMDVLYVGKRSPEADDWRRRHQVGKSVRLAPEGELDHLLPDMAADHRWKHVSGGSNANGNDAMRVLQVALACVAVLSVLVMIGYGLGVRGS